MSDKLSASHSVSPSADGNWRIAPIAGVHPAFLSGSAATKFLGKHPGIRLVQDNGDGSALYELAD